MRRIVLPCVTVTLAALWLMCCSGAWRAAAATNTFPAPYGPLHLVNQQPVQLLFLQPFPAPAEVTPFRHVNVDLNVALSNTVVVGKTEFTADLDQDDALGIGDIVLQAKAKLLHAHDWFPALSLRAAVKFPSGDPDRAFGSGKVDGSLGVLLQKTFRRFTFYMNGDVTFPGQAFNDVGVSLQPFFLGLFAIEFRVSRPVSLVLQVRGDTRPFHDTINILDRRLLETDLGVNWSLSRHLLLQAGLAQDQFNSACCAADVSVFLNLTGRF